MKKKCCSEKEVIYTSVVTFFNEVLFPVILIALAILVVAKLYSF